MSKPDFIKVIRSLEDRAHEANIRDADMITNKLAQFLFDQE